MSINREKIEVLKNVLRELHAGVPMEELKRKFKDALDGQSEKLKMRICSSFCRICLSDGFLTAEQKQHAESTRQ